MCNKINRTNKYQNPVCKTMVEYLNGTLACMLTIIKDTIKQATAVSASWGNRSEVMCTNFNYPSTINTLNVLL